MNQYLTAVRETEIRTGRADSWLNILRPEISEKDRRRIDRDVPQTHVGDYIRTIYDLIVLAFQTDATRAVTFSSGIERQGPRIPEVRILQLRHELSHHNVDRGHMVKSTQSDAFSVEWFSCFLTRLAETPDLNGRPLLATTMSLFGSGMAYGHSYGNANLPVVQAGGVACGLNHGRYVDLNQGHFDDHQLDDPGQHYRLCGRAANSNVHISNPLLTMTQKTGVETEHFGDSHSELNVA